MIDYDSELRAHYPHLVAAAALGAGEDVLDVGCGAGQTTRDAGRAAAPGSVLGIDVSEPLLDRARRLTAEAGLDNVAYELADAQVHPFRADGYDAAISRFGTMFFGDPVAAFANIARALRPGGRLVQLVWQVAERNEWASEIARALGGPSMASDAFSLGEPATARRALERGGFAGVRLEEVREPVFYGEDTAAALEFVCAFQTTRDALARLAADEAERARARLRDVLDGHRTDEHGVAFESRAWIISAYRAA